MKRVIKIKFLALIIFLPIYCLLSTAGSLYAQDKIAAIVNNEVITQKDLNDFLHFTEMQLSKQYKGKELAEKLSSLKMDLINRLIEDRLILQEAKKEKLSLDPSRVKAKMDEVRKRYNSDAEFQAELASQGLTRADIENKIKEQFLMFAIVEQKVRSRVSIMPDEITDFYEKNKQEFRSGEEKEFEAFALESKDLADTFSYNLKSGQKVEDLASRYPFTMNKFNAMQGEDLKKEIQEAVAKLGINEISDSVKIDDKYYVFRLINIIPPKELSLSEAQYKIQTYLFERKMQEDLAKWLDELKNKAYIKINQD